MAAAKKSSKKKSSKSKRANACARGGSEMRTIKGTSPRSVRRRSLAAFDLVTCRKARPVKVKKRAPKKRASVKNGRQPSKWVTLFVVQGNYGYGHGWEDVDASDTRAEARTALKEYRANSPGAHRIISRKVLRADNNVAYKRPSR